MSTPIEKIKKLQGMLRATGPEAANAQRLINTLMAKYNLDPADIDKPEDRKRIVYKVHRLKKYAMHLSNWMQISCYTVPGKPDFIAINVTDDEYLMFHELLGDIKHIFNKKEHEFMDDAEKDFKLSNTGAIYSPEYYKPDILKLKNAKHYGFMQGYMKANYPYNRNLCTVCKEGEIEMIGEDKWKCPKCNTLYRSQKWQSHSMDKDAYNDGYSTTTKALRNNVKAIGYNN